MSETREIPRWKIIGVAERAYSGRSVKLTIKQSDSSLDLEGYVSEKQLRELLDGKRKSVGITQLKRNDP